MDTIIGEFQRYFITQGKAAETVKSYSKSLRQFFSERHISGVASITGEQINEWIFALRERGSGDQNISKHLWAIKAFLKWLTEEKKVSCYEFNIKIPSPKAPETIEYLEPEELEWIFATINENNVRDLRLRVLIEVMINTGVRPSEALELNKVDLEVDEVDIVGKGGKKRKIYINERTHEWINKYLACRHDEHPALFVTQYTNTHRLSLRHAQSDFLQHFRATRIRKRITLHTLRHTYATTLLANGCPIDYVAMLLGHSRPEITRRHYVSIQHKHAKQAHFRFLSYDPTVSPGNNHRPELPVA